MMATPQFGDIDRHLRGIADGLGSWHANKVARAGGVALWEIDDSRDWCDTFEADGTHTGGGTIGSSSADRGQTRQIAMGLGTIFGICLMLATSLNASP